MSTIKRSDNLFPFPIQPNFNFAPQKQDGNEFTPYNFTKDLLKEQKKPELRLKKEPVSNATCIPVNIEEDSCSLHEASSDSITPSPMNTEDEEDTTGILLIYAIHVIYAIRVIYAYSLTRLH